MTTSHNGAQGKPHGNGAGSAQGARTTDRSTARGSDPGDRPDKPAPHPLEPLLAHLAEARAFALHYVEAQKDSLRATIRRLVLQAIVGAGAGVVGLTLVITCTVFLLQGMSQLIAMAAGGRSWVGNLAVGGGLLLILALVTAAVVALQTRRARKRTIRKYESRHHAQRTRFGADVPQRATS